MVGFITYHLVRTVTGDIHLDLLFLLCCEGSGAVVV